MTVELGLDTFGDVTVREDGTPETAAQVLRNLVGNAAKKHQLPPEEVAALVRDHLCDPGD